MDYLYEKDYNGWIEKQKSLLQSGMFDELDIENLIEELADMGDSYLNALESHLEVLLIHLLKYNYQKIILKDPWVEDKVAHTWFSSICNPRRKITKLLNKKPSLKPKIDETFKESYLEAKVSAIKEMNYYIRDEKRKLNDKSFPDNCPWDFEQIMKEDWLPEEKVY